MSTGTVVLVIESDDEVRAGLRNQLEDSYQILEADGVQGAIETEWESAPDLVVSDVRAPEWDGLSVYRRIKDDPELSAVPFVLIVPSGEDAQDVEDRGTCPVFDAADPDELRGLVGHLLEGRREPVERRPTSDAALRDRIEDIVERRLGATNFTVEQLAEAVGWSRRHLTRRMKQAMGTTPAAFIRMRRLERAKERLASQPRTVSEVAEAVGFSSASAFSKAFREQVGCTPSAYVEENGP